MKNSILFLVCTLMIFSACSNTVSNTEEKNNKLIKVSNSTLSIDEDEKNESVKKRLEDLASRIPNVNDAFALTIGDYAIVALDLDGELERSEVGTIKYSVAESLRHDPFGAKSVIVAGPDIKHRAKEWWSDIKNGHPVSGFFYELSDIIGRYMPTIPADLIEPHNKSATEDSKKGLNKEENQQLDEEQDNQSNNFMN